MRLSERIASEIMDTIERERRINKDDLIAAAERVLQRWEREQHPAYLVLPGEVDMAWAEANEALIHPPVFISAQPAEMPQVDFERVLWPSRKNKAPDSNAAEG